jgi:hypothetical protein
MRYEGNECTYCIISEGGIFTYGALVGTCVKGVSWQVAGGYALAAANGIAITGAVICCVCELAKDSERRGGSRNNARVAVSNDIPFPASTELQIVSTRGRAPQDLVANRVSTEDSNVPFARNVMIEIPAEMARALDRKIVPGQDTKLLFLNAEQVKALGDLGIARDNEDGGVVSISEEQLDLVIDQLGNEGVRPETSMDRGAAERKEGHEKYMTERKESHEKGRSDGVRAKVTEKFSNLKSGKKISPGGR